MKIPERDKLWEIVNKVGLAIGLGRKEIDMNCNSQSFLFLSLRWDVVISSF